MTDSGHNEQPAADGADSKSDHLSKLHRLRRSLSKLVHRRCTHDNGEGVKSADLPHPLSSAEGHSSASGNTSSNVLAGYKGPVHNAETGQTVWGGQPSAAGAAYASPQMHPEGGRTAHSWLSMDADQQRAFDNAGRLPIRNNAGGGLMIAGSGPPRTAIEAGNNSGGSGGGCSGCGNAKGGNVKKFATNGGLMRPLCGDCVYDRVGGDQAAYAAEWAKGKPL
ncbi:uncharacterized protein AB675_9553 [Cyphellophora attinorum]|uniref:Uncharacterized protein n=1 Tax=Cyphellophora attinorum TaxID=1664694 RepID=A0A0N1H797_9EURO|nr:uncharacterized protein AB675_9553 [Phialophora attinorum]KPI42306.1 hypothetical protein AB675_9553 [Phialophora attinorum]